MATVIFVPSERQFCRALTCATGSFQLPGAKKLALTFESVNDLLLNS